MKYYHCLIFLMFAFGGMAQSLVFKGIVKDHQTEKPLSFANVVLFSATSDTVINGTVAGFGGSFSLEVPVEGIYILEVSFVGYETYREKIKISTSSDLQNIKLKEDKQLLQEVEITDIRNRVTQMGDTTQYNAAAFKTNPDASAQDLISKMPGVVVQDGKIKAQGEDVEKVLVDGKEFFSHNPNMALQNIPADMVDKVEVYDKKSDQAEFTGVEDGKSEKTINIITKEGKNEGYFGKIYGGYGTDNRYIGGGSVNIFRDNERITILGLSNNINQQNFAAKDLLGVMAMPMAGGGMVMTDNSFWTGRRPGINKTNAIGINYSNEWGEKLKVSGSYFFNHSRNANEQLTKRKFIGKDVQQLYNEQDSSVGTNLNQRFNFRITYDFDKKNSIIFSPSLSWQKNEGRSFQNSGSIIDNMFISGNSMNSISENEGLDFSGKLLYRHKFNKERRTISLDIRSSNNSGNGSSFRNADFYSVDSTYTGHQSTLIDNRENIYSAALKYTEPLGKNSTLMFEYSPSLSLDNSDRRTYTKGDNGDHDLLDTSLSNVFRSSYVKHAPGLTYNWHNDKKSYFMLGVLYENAELKGDQSYPHTFIIGKSFNNILASAMFRKTLNDTANFRLFYRSDTREPRISQLQDVVNNTNPLYLQTGNPDLGQEYYHYIGGYYRLTMPKTARTLFMYGNIQITQNRIVNSTFSSLSDTTAGGVEIPAGARLTRPVNLDGHIYARITSSYGMPILSLKSNLNINVAISYTKSPGLVNEVLNYAHATNPRAGLVFSSNISENLDFTCKYSANYNFVSNSIENRANSNYFYHNFSLTFNWIFGGGFVFNSDLSNRLYNGLSQGFNQNFTLWNVGFGYKFLKKDAAEIKLRVYDLLDQNNNLSRDITETYIEDVQNKALSQYLMLTFTYNLRNFEGDAQDLYDPKKVYIVH